MEEKICGEGLILSQCKDLIAELIQLVGVVVNGWQRQVIIQDFGQYKAEQCCTGRIFAVEWGYLFNALSVSYLCYKSYTAEN